MAIDPIVMPDASGTAPTLDDVINDYLLYADWESYKETESSTAITRARLFVTACTRLMVLLPSASTTRQRTSAEFEIAEIRRQKELAQRYLTIAGSTAFASPTQHVDLQNFRD
jgi:hypothetical protein